MVHHFDYFLVIQWKTYPFFKVQFEPILARLQQKFTPLNAESSSWRGRASPGSAIAAQTHPVTTTYLKQRSAWVKPLLSMGCFIFNALRHLVLPHCSSVSNQTRFIHCSPHPSTHPASKPVGACARVSRYCDTPLALTTSPCAIAIHSRECCLTLALTCDSADGFCRSKIFSSRLKLRSAVLPGFGRVCLSQQLFSSPCILHAP